MTILLIDDERDFLPGFKETATVARTTDAALAVIEATSEFDEIWLDFNLAGSDSVDQVLSTMFRDQYQGIVLPKVGKWFLHSSSFYGDDLLKHWIVKLGYDLNTVERIWDRKDIFVNP